MLSALRDSSVRFVVWGLLAAIAVAGLPAATSVHAEEQAPTVALVPRPGYGLILTDGAGWTLYTWDGDTEGQSNCYDACAEVWPPYIALGPLVAPEGLPGGLGLLDRGDGTWQITFNNWPLYYFTGDTQPGETNGDGSQGFDARWYVMAFSAPEVAAPPASPPVSLPSVPVAPPAAVVPSTPAVPPGLGAIPAGPGDPGAMPPVEPSQAPPPSMPPGFGGPLGPSPQPEGLGPGFPLLPFAGPLPPPPGGPFAPEGYSPTVTAVAPPNGSVSLSWLASPGVQSYRIYQTLASQPLNFSVQQTVSQLPGQLVTNATVSGLIPGALYFFQVRAVDPAGQEAPAPAIAAALPTYGSVVLAPPTGVIVTSSTGTTAQLSWSSVPGATSYRVWQAPSPVGPFSLSTVVSMTSSGATVTGLSPNTTYYFQVAAADAAGNQGPPSVTIAGSTSPTLAAPTNVGVVNVSASSATLVWSPVPGVASYQISQSSSLNGPYTPVVAVGANANTAVIGGLQPQSSYYFQVTAVDANGNPSPASNPAMGVTPPAVLGPAPTNPTPSPTAAPTPVPTPLPAPSISVTSPTANSVTVTWTSVPGAAAYQVLQSPSASGPFVQVASVGAGSTTAVVGGLAPSTTYHFRVAAVDAAGVQGQQSATASGTTALASPGVSVVSATSTSVTLSWTQVPGAIQYLVTQSRPGVAPAPANLANPTPSGATVIGLTAGTAYTFQVTAVDATGNQSAPGVASATTVP